MKPPKEERKGLDLDLDWIWTGSGQPIRGTQTGLDSQTGSSHPIREPYQGDPYGVRRSVSRASQTHNLVPPKGVTRSGGPYQGETLNADPRKIPFGERGSVYATAKEFADAQPGPPKWGTPNGGPQMGDPKWGRPLTPIRD